MSEEKLQAHEIAPQGKMARWFHNYWYYYKWRVIIVTFFVVIILVGLFQFVGRETPDVYVLYAGPLQLQDEDVLEMKSALRSVMSYDYDGDGEKLPSAASLFIMTNREIEEAYAKAREEDEHIIVFGNLIAENLNNFDSQVMGGDTGLYFLSPYLYNRVGNEGGWIKLSDIFDTVPDSAVDEYAVRLADTEFGRFFTVFAGMPEDTLVCVRSVSGFSFIKGQTKSEAATERHKQLLRDIVAFKLPE